MNILLIEDQEASRSILANLLTHCGHEVATAETLAGALQLLDNLRFDVLVSDIELPDGSGLDLVVEARKRQVWKKTIALTAHGQSGEREMGRRAGYDEYLTKPFDFYRLRSIIAAAQ
ncbi:MAG: response regulator [Chthoniobacterales bacterium]